MTLTSSEIAVWLGLWFWPFVRIGACLIAAPVFGARILPHRFRLVAALLLTVAVAPLLPEQTTGAGAAWPIWLLREMAVGFVLGFALRVAFTAVELAGQMIGSQMGLGFAALVDPENGVSVPVLSQFYTLIALLLFLAFDGHHVLISLVAESFRLAPVGGAMLPAESFAELPRYGSLLFAGAFSISLPALTALMLINLAIGVMTRAAPSLNLFSVGFPGALLAGQFVLLLTLPMLAWQVEGLSMQSFEFLGQWLAGVSDGR